MEEFVFFLPLKAFSAFEDEEKCLSNNGSFMLMRFSFILHFFLFLFYPKISEIPEQLHFTFIGALVAPVAEHQITDLKTPGLSPTGSFVFL